MNVKRYAMTGLAALFLGASAAWAGGPWHHPAHGGPDVIIVKPYGPHHGHHHAWDRRPVTVVREKTVIYRDWAPPPRVVEYRYARPYYGPGVTIDVSPVFIPFR
jgi:hypothetical protein